MSQKMYFSIKIVKIEPIKIKPVKSYVLRTLFAVALCGAIFFPSLAGLSVDSVTRAT